LRTDQNKKAIWEKHMSEFNLSTLSAKKWCAKEKLTEESYTSKASFLDEDKMPVYKEKNKIKYTFSGKRIKRGLYQSKNGILLNADCNGSANIIKKVFPNAFSGKRNSGVMDTPIVVNVL